MSAVQGPKRRPGRPRLSPDAAKGRIFSIRLGPAEREAVEQVASRAGRKASDWARDVLLAVAQPGTRSDRQGAP
jgi:hypothetical protein